MTRVRLPHVPHEPHNALYYDDKIFGPFTLLWMLRLVLFMACIGTVIFTVQLIEINDAAHERKELRNSVCVLIAAQVADHPDTSKQLPIIQLARHDHCGGFK